MKTIITTQSILFAKEVSRKNPLPETSRVNVGVATVVPDWVLQTNHFKLLLASGAVTVLDTKYHLSVTPENDPPSTPPGGPGSDTTED